ncbi:hypothetical protein EWM64_g5670 [Hericium alpestre]|uniref:Peptidase S53 domain-containing protein n=1 Tax=Hericium alpestre TaxID=135208 RepID=A0A4Y9ZTW0_9AGAM|nr:hypothetical protein EWM64_g5670 [Hericium alpestre]
MLKIFILFASLASLACASPLYVHERRSEPPSNYTDLGPAPADHTLTLRLALVPNNMDGLHEKLYEISTPSSPTYRQWLSKEEVEVFVAPSSETSSNVKNWLSSNGISYETVSPAGDWLSIDVTVARANTLLGAQFSTFKHKETSAQIVRTPSYSIPASLKGHLDFVHPTIAFPMKPKGGPHLISKLSTLPKVKRNNLAGEAPSSCDNSFTPSCAQELYGIPTTFATHVTNQLDVSAFENEYASQSDLELFLQAYRPDLEGKVFAVEFLDGGENIQSSPGLEANLDTQYTVGIASNVTVNFVSVGNENVDDLDGFLDIVNLFLIQNPTPHVFTTSYQWSEYQVPFSLANTLCNAYAQLENVNPEIAASFSSGGFSNYFARPSYQTDAVNSYFAQLGSEYAGLYNASGRGIPDISAAGYNYVIAWFGAFDLVYGTSCSSPLFASIVALLDDELAGRGQPPLGFLNPLIYSTPQAFNDITAGSNPGCGTEGFPALPGWDPVTGIGSPIYSALRTAAGL